MGLTPVGRIERLVLLTCLGGLLPVLAGCLDLEHPPSIAVSPSGDGTSITIFYKPCHSSTVILEVWLADARGTWSDGDDDETLWQISSTRGTTDREFVVGQTPTGYDELVPFQSSLDEGMLLRVSVATSELPHGESALFRLRDLRKGSLLVDGHLESESKFRARNACG